jgi:hypothetical protein
MTENGQSQNDSKFDTLLSESDRKIFSPHIPPVSVIWRRNIFTSYSSSFSNLETQYFHLIFLQFQQSGDAIFSPHIPPVSVIWRRISSEKREIFFYYSMAPRPIFGPFPARCQGFATIEISRDEDIAQCPTPKPRRPGYLYVSGISSKPAQYGWPYQ